MWLFSYLCVCVCASFGSFYVCDLHVLIVFVLGVRVFIFLLSICFDIRMSSNLDMTVYLEATMNE